MNLSSRSFTFAIFLAAMGLGLSSATVHAAPKSPEERLPGAKPLTWEQCLQMARDNSADLKAAEAALRSLEAQEGAAASAYYPSVTGVLGYDESYSVGDAANATGYRATLNANANLFNGLADKARVAQAKARIATGRAQVAQAKAKLSYDLKSSFEGVVFAQKYAALTREIVRRRQDNLRMVELRFDSGRENKGSVLLARAYLAESQYDEMHARNAREIASRQLSRDIGFDDSRDVSVADEVPVSEPSGPDPDFRALAALTPDHQQALAQEQTSREGVTVARGAFFPTLGVSGSIGRVGAEFFPQREGWALGVALSFPLFSGGKDYYGYRSSVEDLTQAASSRLSVDRGLPARLAESYLNYVEAVSKLKVDESFRDAETMRAEISRNKYNNGLMNFDDWDRIENELIGRQKAYVSSQRDRVVSEAAWEQTRGVGVIP